MSILTHAALAAILGSALLPLQAAAQQSTVPPKETAAQTSRASADLAKMVGTYQDTTGRAITITLEKDTLYGTPTGDEKRALVLQSGTTFYVGQAGAPMTVTFTLGAGGKATEMIMRRGERELRLARVP